MLAIIKRFLDTEDFFECNIKYLFLTGLWPENLTGLKLKLYRIYHYTLTMFMIIFLIISGIGIARCTDIIKFISDIDKSIVSYNFLIKLIYFTIRREQLKLLIKDIVNSGDKVTDRARENMIKLPFLISFLSALVLTAFSLNGLVNNELAIEAWMPFDPFSSTVKLVAAAQILIVIYPVPFVFRNVGIECLVCTLLIYICDQLENLQMRIRELKYTKENEKLMGDELKQIVRKHIRLVRYANSIETMFKEFFLIQHLCLTLEICINAVLVATVLKDSVDVIVGFMFYLGLALVNGFIYCSLGNSLVLQSQDISQAAYDSDWTAWPVELQRTVLLMVTVAQRPLKISAGGFVRIDIQAFGNALYNGYSIFAVLNDAVN